GGALRQSRENLPAWAANPGVARFTKSVSERHVIDFRNQPIQFMPDLGPPDRVYGFRPGLATRYVGVVCQCVESGDFDPDFDGLYRSVDRDQGHIPGIGREGRTGGDEQQVGHRVMAERTLAVAEV